MWTTHSTSDSSSRWLLTTLLKMTGSSHFSAKYLSSLTDSQGPRFLIRCWGCLSNARERSTCEGEGCGRRFHCFVFKCENVRFCAYFTRLYFVYIERCIITLFLWITFQSFLRETSCLSNLGWSISLQVYIFIVSHKSKLMYVFSFVGRHYTYIHLQMGRAFCEHAMVGTCQVQCITLPSRKP